MGWGRKIIDRFAGVFADKLVDKSITVIQDKSKGWTSDKILAGLSVIGDLFNRPISDTTTKRVTKAFGDNIEEVKDSTD